MSTMRKLVLAGLVSAGMASAAFADETSTTSRITFGPVAPSEAHPNVGRKHLASHIRPHDRAHVVTRLARAEWHETGSFGVNRVKPNSMNVTATAQRVAVLDRQSNACDSLLCPGYAMLGVGF